MKVRFLDLSISNSTEKRSLLRSIEKIFDHGQLVMGPEIELFEKEISTFCSRKFAISVGSGTEALYLALRSLDIGPGDEVITTSLSWIATANAIALTGATPVFSDINDDLNIDPSVAENLITEKTKAILFVNYTGKICAIDKLEKIAKKHNIDLIEDGSQSFGASFRNSVSGSFGKVSAISHNPMKIFGATGEAGSVLVDDEKLFEKLIMLRYNGTVNKEECLEPSLNCRMDTLQAAILLERLKTFKKNISKRRENSKFFESNLLDPVIKPIESEENYDVFYTYTVQVPDRDKLREHLENNGIETKIQHPILMPDQEAYRNCKSVKSNAEKIVKKILCIPVHEKLKKHQLEYIVNKINDFYS